MFEGSPRQEVTPAVGTGGNKMRDAMTEEMFGDKIDEFPTPRIGNESKKLVI